MKKTLASSSPSPRKSPRKKWANCSSTPRNVPSMKRSSAFRCRSSRVYGRKEGRKVYVCMSISLRPPVQLPVPSVSRLRLHVHLVSIVLQGYSTNRVLSRYILHTHLHRAYLDKQRKLMPACCLVPPFFILHNAAILQHFCFQRSRRFARLYR